ncbi:transglutaminase domain-containing protein [Roseibacillus ishigakijimensis]|uniref:Dienelactone hydrolase family protein n=1 Tax=Roseibacillus ishigakijimensis TaxID=454146 RepID=A0A934RKG1_9BACT|nr:transglutaminase domain-containing protein [Roseibacillus ishigakijimensis]MBK1833362.1 dienelactone hydrolase family protein [Roseibacillus ishigakijimensis]
MRRFLLSFVFSAGLLCWLGAAEPFAALAEEIRVEYGEPGAEDFAFLVSYMPPADLESVSAELLQRNVELAFRAREEFPWSAKVPRDLFRNEVLPYALLDEKREDWRPRFYEICRELVRGCATASEAAQVLNRDLFNKLNVHYHTGRKKPNQSPSESMASGKATCTGLSIILAYGCRSVGIPARVAGTAMWSDKSGNHTWVEIWDGEWKFLGADEYDEQGLNRAWFTDRAAKAVAGDPLHAIWASSWQTADGIFPLVWDRENETVFAKNVTSRYARDVAEARQDVAVRVFSPGGKERVVAEVSQLDAAGQIVNSVFTKAGRADLNDVASLPLTGEGPWSLQVLAREGRRELTLQELPEGTLDLVLEEKKERPRWDFSPLVEGWRAEGRADREQELTAKVVRAAGKEMKFLEKRFGEAPAAGHSLWISLHGGGNAPARVNDRQWQNQIQLYQPEEGYYVAPRAPTDTWNLWHEAHIDELLDRLISNYVVCRGVDPNRVYLLGYSAGGDGVYQLAPRMADRFAAAAMMAGHPNEARPDGLRNLPFEIFMGERDGAYDRNKIAAQWKELLGTAREEEQGEGYPHRVTIYPGLGHWMEGKDAEVISRMATESRVEWPRKVVWLQDDVTHERLYWLGVDAEGARKGRKLIAEVNGQTITVEGEDVSGLRFWLSDELLDLEEEIVVIANGEEVFRGQVRRQPSVAARSLRQRCGIMATALLELE